VNTSLQEEEEEEEEEIKKQRCSSYPKKID
jgi:hypothetical protein